MAKLSLQCAIVGQIGSSFDVEIDDGEKVSKLKDAIKTKNKDDPILKTVAAKNLQLFLAKQGNAWLPDDDPAAQDLNEGKVHTEIQALIPDEHRAALKLVNGESDDYINALTAGEQILASKTIETWLYEKIKMEEPSTAQTHVLVVVP
eukprot:jgi/Phyca11/108895/e_gw1.16.149.1